MENLVKVYFESESHAELVATFETEELYITCLPALQKEALNQRMIVTESIGETNERKYRSDGTQVSEEEYQRKIAGRDEDNYSLD